MSSTRLFHILAKFPFRRVVVALFLMATIVCAATPSTSDDFTDRRLTIGAKIFRALLAADIDLERKTTADGKLNLCLLYLDDPKNAAIVARALTNRDDSRIRGKEVHIEILPFTQVVNAPPDRYAGIFLTQKLNESELSQLVTFSSRHSIISFSPYEGDIERGVQGGIAVEARVRPYLNLTALRNAGIRLKSFFMEVAKKHE
jgi:hypothetical protein